MLVILGPTASGKTALSIALAQHFSTAIISADSRQFYKEMPIGTAAPTAQELAAAPHYFVQHLSVTQSYSVGQYEAEVADFLSKSFLHQPLLILSGGSGLYIDAVLNGLNQFPDIPSTVRQQLNQLFKQEGLEALQKMLKEKDPAYFEKVDAQNPRRLIRALEVCLSSGRPYSSFLTPTKPKRDFSPVIIGLNPDRKALYQRIDERVDAMLTAGLETEVRALLPYKHTNALQTLGYREWFDYFDGKKSYERVVEEIKQNSRRYAKRQLTWFKRYPATWFDPLTTKQADMVQRIAELIEEKK